MKLTVPSCVAMTNFPARVEIVFQRIGVVMVLQIAMTNQTNFKPIAPNTTVWMIKSSDVTERESKLLNCSFKSRPDKNLRSQYSSQKIK
jgi:hypothetical protein